MGDNSLPLSSFQPLEQDIHEPEARPAKGPTKNFVKPASRADYTHGDSIAESRSQPDRPKSPLKPPSFYTVRLSNAPIFLRRTTLRPPTLDFLNRSPSPRRSSSPVSRSTNQSPVNRGQSSIYRGHSPVKQEVFRNNPIANERASIGQDQKITEDQIVKLINEAVQTGPLKKTHGTQMTPYDSEASDIAGILFWYINL